MRSLPIDHCPCCGVVARGNTYCARCEVDMVDANGHPRIEPSRDEAASSLRPKHLALIATLSWAVNTTFILLDPMTYRHQQFPGRILASTAGTVAWATIFAAVWLVLAARRHLRLLRPWKLVRRIADARPGDVRIRGVVRTLTPCSAPEATPTMAIRVGRQVQSPHPLATPGDWIIAFFEARLDPSRFAAIFGRRLVVDSSVGGRFVVSDGTGVAVVDDDALEVFDARPLWSRLLAPFETIEDGDEVDVLGPAKREIAADACILGGARREHAGQALVFDGRPEAKVRILLRRAERRAPLPVAASSERRLRRAPMPALSR